MVSGHEIDLHKLYTIIPMRVYDREPSNKFIAGYRNLFLHFLSKTVQEQDLANKSLNPNLQKKDTKQIKIKKKKWRFESQEVLLGSPPADVRLSVMGRGEADNIRVRLVQARWTPEGWAAIRGGRATLSQGKWLCDGH